MLTLQFGDHLFLNLTSAQDLNFLVPFLRFFCRVYGPDFVCCGYGKIRRVGEGGGGYCELFYYTTQRIQANSPILGLYLKPRTFLFTTGNPCTKQQIHYKSVACSCRNHRLEST
jgi:hypothetical protein